MAVACLRGPGYLITTCQIIRLYEVTLATRIIRLQNCMATCYLPSWHLLGAVYFTTPTDTPLYFFSGHRSSHPSSIGSIPPIGQHIPGPLPLYGGSPNSVSLLEFVSPPNLASIPVTNQAARTSPISSLPPGSSLCILHPHWVSVGVPRRVLP